MEKKMHFDRFGIIKRDTVFESLFLRKSNKTIKYNDSLVSDIVDNKIDLFLDDLSRYFKISDPKDLLISGCSLTASTGVAPQHTWSALLFDYLKIEYNNIAHSGDSVYGQCMKIYAYIKKFGKPKYIIAIFPNFERMQIINNAYTFRSHRYDNLYDANVKSGINKWHLVNKFTMNVDKYQNKKHITKFPLEAEKIMNQETAMMYSFNAINALSLYCKEAGITLIWSTWDPFSDALIKQNNKNGNFEEFVSIDPDMWMFNDRTYKDTYYKESLLNKFRDSKTAGNLSESEVVDWYYDNVARRECNHDEYESYEYYETGTDQNNGVLGSHFGMHRHIHYAKIIYETLIERIKYEK
jgi:hypothetical protein